MKMDPNQEDEEAGAKGMLKGRVREFWKRIESSFLGSQASSQVLR